MIEETTSQPEYKLDVFLITDLNQVLKIFYPLKKETYISVFGNNRFCVRIEIPIETKYLNLGFLEISINNEKHIRISHNQKSVVYSDYFYNLVEEILLLPENKNLVETEIRISHIVHFGMLRFFKYLERISKDYRLNQFTTVYEETL